MAAGFRRLVIFFLVSEFSSAIFFGGGGGCGCSSCCQPPPPPPSCSCAAPPPPPRPCYSTPRCPAAPLPPPPPSSYPVPPVPPPPSPNSYSAATSYQEKVPAARYSVEPVPIEKPAPPKFEDDYSANNSKGYKSKADAEDYEVLSNAGYRRKPQKRRTKDEKCINEHLRRIIHKSITESSDIAQAKRSISSAAKEAFGYNFDVICAEKPFIFTVNGLFCQLSVGDVFCFAFQH